MKKFVRLSKIYKNVISNSGCGGGGLSYLHRSICSIN